MRILKENFDPTSRTSAGFVVIDLPTDAGVLKIAEQDSMFGQGLKIWYVSEQADETFVYEPRYFALIMTGQEFTPVEWNYVTSFEVDTGIIVHVFQVPADKIAEEDKLMPQEDGEPTKESNNEQPTGIDGNVTQEN